MNKRLNRLIGLLLVPCLMADPGIASAFSTRSLPVHISPAPAFESEALTLALVVSLFAGLGLNRHPAVLPAHALVNAHARREDDEPDDSGEKFHKMDLNDPENRSPEKLFPIISGLSNQKNSNPKSVRDLAGRVAERLTQLGELKSFHQLSNVNGLGSAWSEMSRYCFLGGVDSDISFPQQPPPRKEIDDFERRYELVAVNSEQLVPVVSMPGYHDFSEDTLIRTLGIAEQKTAALRNHSGKGPGSILSPLNGGWANVFQAGLQLFDPRLQHFLHGLPESERAFFHAYIDKHLPRALFGRYTSFLLDSTVDAMQVLETFSWQDVSNLGITSGVIVDAIKFFKGLRVQRYANSLVSTYAYLWNADPRAGICIPGEFILSPERKDPSLFDRYESWAMTPEGRAFYQALNRINPGVQKIPRKGSWPRDQFAYLAPNQELGIFDKREENDVASDVADSRHPLGLQHEGAVIPGRFRTNMVFVSSDIPESERRVLAWKLKGRGIAVYSLPPGFLTIEVAAKRYWITEPHFDSVIDIIDPEFTQDDRSKLLIDPFYYDGIKENPEFKRFLAEQRPERDIVVIDSGETGLNLANFTVIPDGRGEKRILFNGQSRTVERLNLKTGVSMGLTPPITSLVLKGGLQRCLTQLMPPDRIPGRPTELEVSIDAEIATSLKIIIQNEIAGRKSHFLSLGLEKVRVMYGPKPQAELNWSLLPTEALVFIPLSGTNVRKIGDVFDEIIARNKRAFGDVRADVRGLLRERLDRFARRYKSVWPKFSWVILALTGAGLGPMGRGLLLLAGQNEAADLVAFLPFLSFKGFKSQMPPASALLRAA